MISKKKGIECISFKLVEGKELILLLDLADRIKDAGKKE